MRGLGTNNMSKMKTEKYLYMYVYIYIEDQKANINFKINNRKSKVLSIADKRHKQKNQVLTTFIF